MTIAKGLGGGYQPIGATLVSGEIYRTIEGRLGLLSNTATRISATLPLARRGLAVVSAVLNRRAAVSAARRWANKLHSALEGAFGQHPFVGDIRGRGLFRGIEFVEDREAKTPFDPARGVNAMLKKTAFQNGLICYPMGGTIDGVRGDHVLLAPPFIVEDAQIDEIVDKLDRSFKAIF